jgi:putative flippase GtrA
MSEPSTAGERATLKQFIVFSIVGGLNTVIDLAVFMLLIVMDVHYAAAQVASYSAGMANSYLMNRAFTFRSESVRLERKDEWRRGLRFAVWNAVMLGLSVLLLASAAEWLHLREWIAKIIVTGLVVAVNFYGSKKWVFAVNRSAELGGKH